MSVRFDSFLLSTMDLLLDLGGSGGDSSSDDDDDDTVASDNERVSMTTECRLDESSNLDDKTPSALP